jgi:hypothetical protein
MLHWGEVINYMINPCEQFQKESKMTSAAKTRFECRALFICTLVEGSLGKQDLNHASSEGQLRTRSDMPEEPPEVISNGPKSAKPSNADDLRSQDLEVLIDVDPSLTDDQRT